jgi:hypothetical protein
MKTGLTQRGWNNVLIFASLFMIVLFNSTHQRFVSNDNDKIKRTLIESLSLLQNIDFNGLRFERIGSGWRTLTQVDIQTKMSPETIIQHWAEQPIEILENEPAINSSNSRFPISLDMIGQQQTQVFEFIIDNNAGVVYIFDHNIAQWLIIDQSQLALFIPAVLLNLNN